MNTENKNLSKPDETRTFGHGKIELVNLGGGVVGKMTLEPGWRWSNDVKPIVNTELCEVEHFSYILSGRMHVIMNDGKEFDFGPGDVFHIAPGHDAWVVGDEPCIGIDWTGATNYAKSAGEQKISKAA